MPENGTTAKRWLFALKAISFVLLLVALGTFVRGSLTIENLSTDGSQRLSAKHFKDLPALISKLRNPPDAILRDIHDQFSANAQSILTNTAFTPAHLESLVITELNSVLTNRCIYDSNRFVNVMLPSEVHKWIQENPKGEQLLRLNLSLLRRAYPEIVVSSIEMRTGMWGYVTKKLGKIQAWTLVIVSVLLFIIIGVVAGFKFATKRELATKRENDKDSQNPKNGKESQNSTSTSFWEVLPFASLVFFTVAVFMLCDLASSPETADAEGSGSVRLLCKLGLYLTSALVTAIVVLYGSHLVKFEGSVGKLTGEMNTARDDVIRAEKKLTTGVEEINKGVGEMTEGVKKIAGAKDQIRGCIQSIELIADTLRVDARRRNIHKGCAELAANDALKPLLKSVQDMLKEMEELDKVSLHPLLSPGTPPPTDSSDTVFDIGTVLGRATLSDPSPHYAYMSAALGRDFQAQRVERYFPGVLLNVAGFAYYVRTIQEIVRSLEPWRGSFEFFTLMPESPLEVFRYANSTDFEEWIEFLEAYKGFQCDNRGGAWRRYFAFRTDKTLPENMPAFHTAQVISGNLAEAAVLCEAKSWQPHHVKSAELGRLLPTIKKNLADQLFRRFRQMNRIPNDPSEFEGGSLVFPDKIDGGPQTISPNCRPLQDVLLEYHGSIQTNAENNFAFLCVNDLADVIASEIRVESQLIPMGNKSEVSKRVIRLPCDLFAIRDVRHNNKNKHKWVFLIGRDTRELRAEEQGGKADDENQLAPAHSTYAFMPIIDLVTLGLSGGNININSAAEICRKLDAIFVDVDGKKAFTLNQFTSKFPR